MFARLNADGSLSCLGTGAAAAAEWPDAERIEIAALPPHEIGDRLVLDPRDPKRAIVDTAARAAKATGAALEAAVALGARYAALTALLARGFPGALEARDRVEAQITEAVRAAAASSALVADAAVAEIGSP